MRHLVDQPDLAEPDDPVRINDRRRVALALGAFNKGARRREKRRLTELAVRARPNAEVIAPRLR